ncbi:hypothetical protein HOLDEFILI_02710, partial [Holdemania filiformis DSM 12042]
MLFLLPKSCSDSDKHGKSVFYPESSRHPPADCVRYPPAAMPKSERSGPSAASTNSLRGANTPE